MRIQCPSCQNSFSVNDDQAERPVNCPSCGQAFTAPALMAPVPPEAATYGVSPAEPRPAILSQAAPVAAPSPSPRPPEPSPPADREGARFVLSQTVLHWVGPVVLIFFFASTFFNWMVATPGGITVYGQSAWQVMTGGVTADVAGDEVFARESELRQQGSFSWLMFLTLVLGVLMALLALADLLEKNINFPVPDAIQTLWPKRLQIFAIASTVLFGLMTLQLMLGVGLATAAPKMAEAWVSQTSAKPSGEESAKQKYVRELRQAEEVARLGIRRGATMWLAWLAAGVACVSFALELALTRRGTRPPPSIEFSW